VALTECAMRQSDAVENSLRTEFSYANHWLRQIWRQDDVAVYERSLTKDKPAHELELVVIKVLPDKIMPNGSLVPAHEAYPTPSQWDSLGWSFPIRLKTWVLSLALKLTAIRTNRAGIVRVALANIRGQ
jgi:hypothetical protein